ncbi:hypothetical protein AKJ61_01585 [candidate division MSBL1 archaeon SCGC-AAA259B11]|uniref:DUF1464 domain-containing protein n=1 Tax=candidate division MSBL1 archaeon SCGC-AAA259B11 TaxID=1698260 RepID=A0A133U780_9EURY|nr:hypothetical protein AKJ61_01585 [candidate division MSBL1 archaeon SCGC-AAA259B11]
MVKAVGTDSGTKSMDLFGFDDKSEEIFLDESIPRDRITKNPEIVVEKLDEVQEEHGRLDCIAASSGYGVPCKRARDTSIEEINLATFMTQKDLERRLKIVGLRELMMVMRRADELDVYFTPGVIQLPTVPQHRKANKIDLGTSDKVYTAALAVKDRAERHSIDCSGTDLIAVEIGFAYTSAMAVERGQIVDGMAGTAGFPGYMGLGFMDSELSYALGNTHKELSKTSIFQGGSAHVAGLDPLKTEIEEFVRLSERDERVRRGYEMMLEAVAKDVASLLPAVKPREIALSGRFTRIPKFMRDVRVKLGNLFREDERAPEIVTLQPTGKVCKEAAEGAAVIANGIAGGKHEKIVETMKIRESRGSIFDHLYLGERCAEKLETFKE